MGLSTIETSIFQAEPQIDRVPPVGIAHVRITCTDCMDIYDSNRRLQGSMFPTHIMGVDGIQTHLTIIGDGFQRIACRNLDFVL